MYQPIYIKIRNIGSIKEMEYNFKLGKTILLQGKNLDNKGQKNNGVGKSSFIDAIGFALTGLSLRKLTTEDFIRDNENEAYIELLLKSKDSVRELLIKRYLHRKKSQLIEIFINGENKHKDEHNVDQRNQLILKEIGIEPEDLFKFFLITKNRYKPYFELSDTDKKAITSRFSNADVVDNVFPLIEKDLQEFLNQKRQIEIEINGLDVKIFTYKEELNNIKNQSNDEYKDQLRIEYRNKITEFENKIKELLAWNEITESRELVSLQNEIDENTVKLELNNKEIAEIDIELSNIDKEFEIIEQDEKNEIITINNEISALEEQKKSIKTELSEMNEAIILIEGQLQKNNNLLESAISCPNCNHEFSLSSNLDLNIIREENENLENDIKVITDAKDKFKIDLFEVDKEINKLNFKIQEIKLKFTNKQTKLKNSRKIFNEERNKLNQSSTNLEKINFSYLRTISQKQTDISKNKNSIELYESQIVASKSQIENIDKLDNKEAIERFDKLIEDTSKIYELKKIELNEKVSEIQNLESWILKFKGFKSYLANQSIKNVEDLVNFYLEKMNTDLSINIEGYLQKGKNIKEKITETVLRNGFPIGSYGRFSGGERVRIDMGSILANQTLINNNASPKGLDFILIDEILESADAIGIENIVKSMDNINKTVILVSQNDINTLPDQTVTFVKQNEQTSIDI